MFEQLPTGKPLIVRGPFFAAVAILAATVGSMLLVQTLWPQEVSQVREKARQIFAPAMGKPVPRHVKVVETKRGGAAPKGPFVPAVFTAPPRVPVGPPAIIVDPPGIGGPVDAPSGPEGPTCVNCIPGPVCVGCIGTDSRAVAPPPPAKSKAEPPPPEAAPKRISVSTGVQAAKLISQPKPGYPPLARQARVQGQVRLTAIIGRDGSIQSLVLVSGHPLLAQAALEAVRRWRYEPTLLNGVPVEVVTQIDVNFTLTQ